VPVEYKKREYEGVPAEDREWEGVIEDILARIHSYRVSSRTPGVRPRFVGRDPEIKRILSDPSVFGHGAITVLYGPRGCGKTTLFEALDESTDLGVHRVFVSLVSEDTIRWVQYTFGPDLYRALLVVDGVGAGGLRRARELLEHLVGVASEHAGAGGWVTIVAVVHAPAAERLAATIGNRVGWALMWNLPREAAEDLAGQLGAVDRVSWDLGVERGEAGELLWRLAGGNPRALDTIAADGLEKWLSREVIRAVKRAIRGYLEGLRGRGGGAGLEDLLKGLEEPSPLSGIPPLEGPDGFEASPASKPMLAEDVLIDVETGEPISQMPREPWVGRAYAYQLPAYHYVVRAIHRKRSTNIAPREVLEEAMRG